MVNDANDRLISVDAKFDILNNLNEHQTDYDDAVKTTLDAIFKFTDNSSPNELPTEVLECLNKLPKHIFLSKLVFKQTSALSKLILQRLHTLHWLLVGILKYASQENTQQAQQLRLSEETTAKQTDSSIPNCDTTTYDAWATQLVPFTQSLPQVIHRFQRSMWKNNGWDKGCFGARVCTIVTQRGVTLHWRNVRLKQTTVSAQANPNDQTSGLDSYTAEEIEDHDGNSVTIQERQSTSGQSVWQTAEDVIDAGRGALEALGRANFSSGVHFCPPHFLDHKFFNEEMATAYKNGCSSMGPLCDYRGKIWEELIYHGLMENLPLVLNATALKCMWVFHGLKFPMKSEIFSLLSIDTEETEVDLLIVAATENDKIFFVPIQIKSIETDGKPITIKINAADSKAKIQCAKDVKCLEKLIKVVSKYRTAEDLRQMIKPVYFLCHSKYTSEIAQPDIDNNRSFKKFNFYGDKYDQFKYNSSVFINETSNRDGTNFFQWLAQIDSYHQVPTSDMNDFENIVCLITTVFSCKTKTTKQHGSSCYSHFRIAPANKEVCMNGTLLSPKYIHQIIVNNINYLTYLNTFISKANQTNPGFQAYSVNYLPEEIAWFARKYFKNITCEQMAALNSDENKVVLRGYYGTGKTLTLVTKALSELEKMKKGPKSGRILFVSAKNALMIDVIPKFEKVFSKKILQEYITFESWDDFGGMETISPNDLCFFDEYAETTKRHYGEIPETYVREAIDLQTQQTDNFTWIAIASRETDINIPSNYKSYDLNWPLRNSHNILNFLMLTEKTQKYMLTAVFDQMAPINPVYGARSRVHLLSFTIRPGSDLKINPLLQSLVLEVKYWMKQLMTGSILIIKSSFTMSDSNSFSELEKLLLQLAFDNLEPSFTLTDLDFFNCNNHSVNTSNNIRGYFTETNDDTYNVLSGLEFDVAILVGASMRNVGFHLKKQISRAKYGISFFINDLGGMNPMMSEWAELSSRWGRCSVIRHDRSNPPITEDLAHTFENCMLDRYRDGDLQHVSGTCNDMFDFPPP